MSESNEHRLRSVRGVGGVRFSHIMDVLGASNQTLDLLLNMPAQEIKQRFKLPKNVADAIEIAFKMSPEQIEVEMLASKGVKILRRGMDEYPKHLEQILKDKAPAILYAWGNLDLLNRPSVGFCGSRSASDKGISITADTVRQVVELGWVVVSGHARGVDTKAHETALKLGGSTIVVVPQGILDFKLRKELKQIAKPDQILVVSEFPPKARWNVGYAMTRNKTIIGLSSAMVLIEAREEGGTFEAGKEALRLKVPLYVAYYQTSVKSSAGNEYFLKRGAKRLGRNPDTDSANIEPLRKEVDNKSRVSNSNLNISVEKSEQLQLI